ncbi:MAG: hypothetical protein R6U61_08615 [Thermoplasmata archaeon]
MAEEKEELVDLANKLEKEKERYLVMAMKQEEKIGKKVEELEKLKEEILEIREDEEDIVGMLRDVVITALKENKKFMVKVMKEAGLKKDDFAKIEKYLVDMKKVDNIEEE